MQRAEDISSEAEERVSFIEEQPKFTGVAMMMLPYTRSNNTHKSSLVCFPLGKQVNKRHHWSETSPKDGSNAPAARAVSNVGSVNRGLFNSRSVCTRCNRIAVPFCSCSQKFPLLGAEGRMQYSEKILPSPMAQGIQESTPKKRALEDDQPSRDISRARQHQALPVQQYQDHATDPVAPEYSPVYSGTFPFILHTMLSEVEEKGLANVVSFRPHGRAFMVNDPASFVANVMPLYFQQTQMSSFVRQLNLYGFTRLNGGKDDSSYYHPYFLRDRVDLCVYIQRTKVKGGFSPNIPSRQPDLWKLPPVGKRKGGMEPIAMTEEMSAGEGPRIPVTPDAKNRKSTSLLSEELSPRPLPPIFNDRPFSSLQTPGTTPTTRVLDIGYDRWVFHLSSTRIRRDGTSSPTSQSQNELGVAVSNSTDDSQSDENGLRMSLSPSVGHTLPVASELVSGEENDGMLQSSETTSDSSQTDSSFSQLIDLHILDKYPSAHSHEEMPGRSSSPVDLQWE